MVRVNAAEAGIRFVLEQAQAAPEPSSSLRLKVYIWGGGIPLILTHSEACKTMFFLINRPWDLQNRILHGRIIWKNLGEISVSGF